MATENASSPLAGTQSPPYAPMVWTAGGPPVRKIDIPAQSIFLILFLIGAVVHMKILKGNRARGHKFLANFFLFLFCMSRVLTSIIRIASVSLPRNVQLALAAQIFVAAGVLILFIINIVFAMRLVRATHRSFGWDLAFSIAFKALFTMIGATLIVLITATIQSSYTLNTQTRETDRAMQLFGTTVLALVATLPLLMVVLTLSIPYSPLDEFGTGRTRTKVIILLVSTTLLSIGAWYRCGIAWQDPVPRTQPLPGYLAKGPFYIFNFLFEFQTVIMYAILRVDKRWHIPDGAKGPGSYSKPSQPSDLEMQDSRPTSVSGSTSKDSSRTTDDGIDKRSEIRIEIRNVEDIPLPPPRAQISRPNSFRLSRPNSSHLSIPTSSRPTSRRTSLLQSMLSRQPTHEQKREWRASQESRIVRRLGGPWHQLPSPTESAFSYTHTQATSPTRSMFSGNTGISAVTGLSIVQAPSIRDTLHEDQHWTPELDFDMTSPRRFQALRKKSIDMLV